MAMAVDIRLRSTNSGTSARRAGWLKPATIPPIRVRMNNNSIVRSPNAAKRNSTSDCTISSAWLNLVTLRRLWRSA